MSPRPGQAHKSWEIQLWFDGLARHRPGETREGSSIWYRFYRHGRHKTGFFNGTVGKTFILLTNHRKVKKNGTSQLKRLESVSDASIAILMCEFWDFWVCDYIVL